MKTETRKTFSSVEREVGQSSQYESSVLFTNVYWSRTMSDEG